MLRSSSSGGCTHIGQVHMSRRTAPPCPGAKRGPMINSDALLTMRTDRTEGMTRSMLSPEELERYARHIVLREVGGPARPP